MHTLASAPPHTHMQHRHSAKTLTNSWVCLNEFEHLCSKLNSLNHLNSFNTFIITECKKSAFKSRFFILFHLSKWLSINLDFSILWSCVWILNSTLEESLSLLLPGALFRRTDGSVCLAGTISHCTVSIHGDFVQIDAHLGGQWAVEMERLT